MADKTPFLGHEHVHPIFASERAANNPSAIEEVAGQVEAANNLSTSTGDDCSLKKFHCEDFNNHASTSRDFPCNPIIMSSYETNKSGLNQSPTFDEEHLREDTVSGNKEVAMEDLRNVKTFQLCLVAPASISGCSAYLAYKGTDGLFDPEPVGLHLEPTLEALGLKFNFWFSDNLPNRDGRICTEIAYHLTVRDARVSTRNPFAAAAGAVAGAVANFARGGGNPESERVVIQTVEGLQHSLLLRFDVVDERGLLLKNHSLGVAQWLAVLTQIIFVANPSNIAECVGEYCRIRQGLEQEDSRATQNHSRGAYSIAGGGAGSSSSSSSSSSYGGNHGVNYGGKYGMNYGVNYVVNYGGTNGVDYGGTYGGNYDGNSGGSYGWNYGGNSGPSYGGNYGGNYGFKPFLGAVASWAARVADKYGGSNTDAAAHNKSIGMKMFLLCLGLFEILKELACREGAQAEGKLYEIYVIVLSSLRKVSVSECGYNPPSFAIDIFRDGVSELVMCISRFSYDWISLLETLGRYDRSWSFLEKVSEFQLDMREVPMLKNSQLAYMNAVQNLLKTNDLFGKEKALRRRTYRIALFASPTFPSFLLAAEELHAWMRGATDWGQTENIEEEIRAELEDGLHQWFTKVMPEMMNPGNNNRPKATYLQQHLELIVEHVKLEPAYANSVLPPFLASSFRRHIVEMLLQTMSKKSDSSTDLVETTNSIVLEYPCTFTLPLLPAEGQLLLKFASSDIDAYVYLSKLIIMKLGSSDGDPKPEDMEYLSKGVLRPWLLASFRRRQSSSPLSYFMCVQEVFDIGVDAFSVFGSCLTQAAVASSLQKSRSLQQFLVGSVGVSQLGESLQVQYLCTIVDMMHRQLDSASNVAELDKISEEILRGLCAQHGHGVLSFIEKTQERLCVELLNKLAEHTGFVESLSTERSFQTISISNFASCLLQIQAAPSSPVKEHWIYVKVREACSSFASSVLKGEVTMGTVESVSRTCHKWKSIFRSIFPVGYESVSSALDEAFQDLELYEKRLQACDRLVNLCRYLSVKGYPIQGLQEWVADLTTRRETLMSTLLRRTAHWPQEVHPSLCDNLESLLLLHESEIFRCILLDSCRRLFEQLKDEQLPSLVDIDEGSSSNAAADASDATPSATFAMVAGDLVPSSIQRYHVEMEPYCGTKNLEKTNMEKLYSVWVTVDELQIDREFELARGELKVEDPKSGWGSKWIKPVDITESIKAWKAIKSKEELVSALRKVANLFQFDESCEGYVERMNYLMNQCDEHCTLKDFTELHQKQGMRLLARLSRNEEFAFIQLAKSEPLINFLRAKVDEDFRNLIDAVEEGSDNDFVQDSILSDLIDLHRMFRPVLKCRTPTFLQLVNVMFNELKTSAGGELASASTLAAKLSKCNENVAQITQFLSSVANRGMRMKDHMKRILKGGQYHFTLKDTVYDVKLTCDSETGFRYFSQIYDSGIRARDESCTYNLAELQDLRSRARLVLSTHKAQAKRYTSDEADSSAAETEEDTGLFIAQVDIVEHLVTSISELCASGHFHWTQFDYPELSGLQELQNLARFVEKELREWYAAVKQARSTHSCLNYFRSMELRLLLEVLSDSGTRHSEMSSTTAEDLCIELLQWAGMMDPRGALKEAQKIYSRDSMDHRNVPTPLSEDLELIAKSLEPLFRRPALSRKSKSIEGSPRHNEALLLALVEESHMEQQAVVSLFHERRLSLRDVPRNVLLCSSFTAWEEIHLLLLHFFQRTAQDVGLFCIAYFEKLSFECQSQFLKVLQEMVHEWEEEHHRPRISEDCEVQLAVVCCSKSQTLLAVFHHLNVRVCHMGASNSVEVRGQLPTECANMRVITSELPGLGKTRRVNSIHTPDDVRTLCVSGNTSRNSLVSQLKELDLQPESVLHLDISSVVNPETFNVLLFELLVLGCLKSDVAGVFHLNTETNIQIELGNTLGNELALSLPVCDWFQREHLTWDLNSLEVSGDPSSDMQVVCIYLQALESEELDSEDLVFSGAASNVTALPSIQCRDLLKRNFVDHLLEENAMSFTVLEMFVKFLACQLRSLTDSVYFQVKQLEYMMAMDNIRSCLVTSLVEVSRDLSLRSVKPWLHEQQQSRGNKITDLTMETRFQGMLRWSDSNHLMIFFQSEGSVLFLYRNMNLLPVSITQLVNSQRFSDEEQQMPDYATMSSHELWSNLWPILQRSEPSFQPTYVLTADNFLKMALISLRVAAQVPVLIMGETGCGKTSLLRVLAKYCGVEFFSITLHAGTTDEDIRFFINKSNEAAILENESGDSKKAWAFLDEINACDHLGFLNGVICHHLLDGKALDANLVVLAACNPYRRHDKENSQAGFSPRDLIMNPGDVQRYNLAYRVHPLPEAMLDYVWDFGLLSRLDEQAYIGAMAEEKVKPSQVQLFADLLVISQAFIRECHGEASVSLRDASRCISLYEYFLKDVPKRPLRTRGLFRKEDDRAMLLAFAHCYHSRLATEQQRQDYRNIFADVRNFRGFTGDTFAELLRAEQLDILDRMDVPRGIAKNKALLENVFVTLVCMVNLIPVFVIGKPGSGKTLALQLIYGNLRGSESRDPYFQNLPQMYKFSYQGSESSTSEGILKVFEKAQRCRNDNEERDVLVVVVLDEVGLAEVSRHNPLKVLHALLEPEEPQQIAVVGISNWSLDAAKMNRAIHLSQPDPSEKDLYDTRIAILESFDTVTRSKAGHQRLHWALEKELRGLARAYHTYHFRQTKPNFHGLRDFYALIKSLQGSSPLDGLGTAVWRNFGGSPEDVQTFSKILKQNLGHEELLLHPPPVMDLVRENLQDKHARHLMLITTGDSAIGIVLEKFQENVTIIHGSKFKDDCSDDYSYLLLSIIILHMEAGRCILLRGLERLWSSLYDMLNQHYTTVADRRNCRIAIGAYSNPMCFVHDNFRCIVVVDCNQVSHLDPPFLNRFEKQVLTYETILSGNQKAAVKILRSWCEQLAGVTSNLENSNDERTFKVHDLFDGCHEDTIPSLVLHHLPAQSEDSSQSTESSEFALLLDRCKEDLLRTAHVDGMVRASLSARCQENVRDLEKWTKLFFGDWQDRQGLKEFIRTAIQDDSMGGLSSCHVGKRVVISTRTIIHMPIKKFLGEIDAQIEKLGDFTSERQLQGQIELFVTGKANLLIIQADALMDKEHIQHARFLVDKNFADYHHAQVSSEPSQVKNIVLIIHNHREMENPTGFTFRSGWQQITLDQLQKEETDLSVFLEHSVADLVNAEAIPLKDIMVKVLRWSFLCIKYPKSLNSATHCQDMVQKICEDRELWGCFKSRVLVWLKEHADPLWQASVASDRRLLSLSSSLQNAFLLYIEEKLRQPIARLVYLLEMHSDLGSYFRMDALKRGVWRAVVLNAKVVNIGNVQAPRHPEGYLVESPLNLSLPFVAVYSQHVDKGFQELYLTQLSKKSRNESIPSSSDEEVPFDLIKDAMEATMRDEFPELAVCIDIHPELYVGDFAKLYAQYSSDCRSEVESQAFEWVLRANLDAEVSTTPPSLHILLWEHGEKLKAQALLVASCLTDTSDVAWKLAQLKSQCLSSADFHQYLVAQCYIAIVPQKEDFLHSGVEIGQWVQKLELLINLASPYGAGSSPRWTNVLTGLEVLRDLAYMVLPPLSLGKETLQGLVKWLGSHGNDFSPGQLVETVLRLAPDLHSLTDSSLQGHWQRFFASFFRKVLHGKTSTMSDVNNIAAFVFELRDITSVMKSLMVCLLDASFSHAPDLDSLVSAQCPIYMQFLFGKCGLQLEEKSFDSDGTHVAFVLLCDVIYESINSSTIEALVRGDEDDGLEWNFEDFFKCMNTALELMDADGPLTIQLAAAFAFLRAILDAVASELEHILRAEVSIACHSSPMVSIFANSIEESSSPSRFAALRLYLLKVLHMQRGLSLVEISSLATRCGETLGLKEYTTLLEWETMHDVVANPLGFDPFWSSSTLFKKSGEAIHYVTSGQENRGRAFFESAATDHASQKQITAAVASRLYLPSAARALASGERAASQWILSRPNCLQQWDPKWTEVVQCFAQGDRVTSIWSGMRLSPNMSTQDLWFKSLAAHILFVVTDLPRTSPLQGYMALEEEHLERAYVLGAPNTSLAAFRTIVANGHRITDYKCSCGFQYFVGDCGEPMESTTCPDCRKPIGGTNHVPVAGTVHLLSDRTQTGYIVDNVARSDTFYSVRNLDHKCYRALRLILHFCLGIGLQRASTTDQALRRLLGLAPQRPPYPQEELHNIIEEDFAKLDLLLACNRDTTVKYMHSVVSFLSGMQNHGALLSPDARVEWEAEFQRIFDNVSFGSGAQRAAADYLERQKGDNRYAELVGERGHRMFASPVEDILRITASPSLANFRALYKQDPGMIAESPLIQVFFNHEKDMEDLRHLMNLVLFCNTAHEVFSSRISRPEAATMSMGEALKKSSALGRQFGNFEKSWNATREKVTGYECRTFSIPIMDKDAPLAMCLVEPRDLGLYIVALFEYLRNIQNTFLDAHASPAVGTSAHGHSRRTVRVQTCKTEDIVHSDEQWLENVVKEVAIANPRSGCGLRLLYDSVIIQEHLLRALVTGKAHLEADWMEFPYKHEAFHRHATILADVATAIPQEVLRSETLQTVHREIELAGVGAGQFLEMLNLCLGFLRRTGGPSQQPLSSYCKLWLDNDSAELISTSTVFDKIYLKHIVSLYEGLEDSASSSVEMLVRKKYKTPLTSALVKEILDSVKTETTWKEEANVERIPVAAFLTALRRFMYRYLSVDNHQEDVQLHIYLTDSRLVKWPADVVSEDVVDDCFPQSLLLQHSFATYMLLSEISTGGDWEKAGQRNGWTTTRETQ